MNVNGIFPRTDGYDETHRHLISPLERSRRTEISSCRLTICRTRCARW